MLLWFRFSSYHIIELLLLLEIIFLFNFNNFPLLLDAMHIIREVEEETMRMRLWSHHVQFANDWERIRLSKRERERERAGLKEDPTKVVEFAHQYAQWVG